MRGKPKKSMQTEILKSLETVGRKDKLGDFFYDSFVNKVRSMFIRNISENDTLQ